MKVLTILFCSILFFSACKDKSGNESKDEKETKFPAAATSKESVKQLIANKYFVTIKAGLFAPGEPGKEPLYEWLDESKDTSSFTREFLEKEMSFELLFNPDSTGIIFYDKQPSFDSSGAFIYVKKSANMTYQVDDSVVGNEEPGIKIRIIEEQWNSFDGRMEKLGSTYIVTGADENGLVLETPRSYRDKTVVVMMTVKDKKGINDRPK